MKSNHPTAADLSKARTGIEGFDEITRGGLPRGRTTLVEGGPGSGKTLMALQTLVNGARLDNEPGIFVAFEESAECIIAKLSPAPFREIAGNLSQRERVLHALGLPI